MNVDCQIGRTKNIHNPNDIKEKNGTIQIGRFHSQLKILTQSDIYLAKLIARVSRITVIFT